MRRRLLPSLAILSLTVPVALAGLWVRSWRRTDFLEYVWPAAGRMQEKAYVMANRGVATFVWRPGPMPRPDRPSTTGFGVHSIDYSFLSVRPPARDALVGFRVSPSRGPTSVGRYVVVSVPLWPAIQLTAIPPAAWAWRRGKREARGFEVNVSGRRGGNQ